MKGRKRNELSKRWSGERVRAILAHYDRHTEDEVASEIDAAFRKPGHAILAVPVELVAKVRGLVAKQRRTKPGQRGSTPKTKRAASKKLFDSPL